MLVLAVLAVPATAQATFPGSNGGIGFAQRTASGDSAPQFVEHTRLAVSAPGRPNPRVLVDCELTDGAPSGGDCTAKFHLTPSYSPNGGRIVFDAGPRLALIDADGGVPRLLEAQSENDGEPAFAPDGRRIVFTARNESGGSDVYVRRLGGGDARLIVRNAREPAWSSRNILAFVRRGKVFVARPDGGHSRRVTTGVSPDWSPNGRRLVIVRPRTAGAGPTGRMYVVAPAGRVLRRVAVGNNTSHPVWSPDGRSIAYDGFDLGVNAKLLGSSRPAREVAPTQVSGESGSITSFDPAWRPLR